MGSVIDIVGANISVFYDEPSIRIEILERKAREFVRRNNIQILFIDYIQYIEGGEGSVKHERKANVSTRLKALARRLNIPVVAAAQLKNYGRDRRPTKDDIAETDQIYRDADGIVIIHHEIDEDTEKILNSELIIAKARDGQRGIIPVVFDGEYLNFREKSSRQDY